MDGVRNIMRKASREKHCQWLIAMVPTVEWAEYILDKKGRAGPPGAVGNPLKAVLHRRDNDVVKTWEDLRAQKAARGKAVDALKLTKLHYTAANGTDLTVGLTPWSKFGHEGAPAVPFTPNIPTEEICTTPAKYETNGVVYASRPLVLGGKKIENFGFRFEKGKVVEVSGPGGQGDAGGPDLHRRKRRLSGRGRPGGVPLPHQHERPGVLHHPDRRKRQLPPGLGPRAQLLSRWSRGPVQRLHHPHRLS